MMVTDAVVPGTHAGPRDGTEQPTAPPVASLHWGHILPKAVPAGDTPGLREAVLQDVGLRSRRLWLRASARPAGDLPGPSLPSASTGVTAAPSPEGSPCLLLRPFMPPPPHTSNLSLASTSRATRLVPQKAVPLDLVIKKIQDAPILRDTCRQSRAERLKTGTEKRRRQRFPESTRKYR